MSNQNFFLGFATFEDLLAQAPNKSVYLMRNRITRPCGYAGVGIDFLRGDWKQGIITGFLGLAIYLNLKYGRFFEPKKEKNIE